jgi:hypothetical protein
MDGKILDSKHVFLDKVPRIGHRGPELFGRKVMP